MAKSSVLDDFTFVAQPTPCSVATAVTDAGLDEAFAHAVEQILAHRRLHGARSASGPNASWLQGKLAAKGVHLNVQALRQHIAGRCSCARGES